MLYHKDPAAQRQNPVPLVRTKSEIRPSRSKSTDALKIREIGTTYFLHEISITGCSITTVLALVHTKIVNLYSGSGPSTNGALVRGSGAYELLKATLEDERKEFEELLADRNKVIREKENQVIIYNS
jgi:tRNA splicing ligase